MKPETIFRQSRVAPFLKTLEHTVFFSIQQLAITGDPDYMLCIRGKFVALELKANAGDLRPLQRWKLEQVIKAGGLAFVGCPSNWAVVSGDLKALARGEEITSGRGSSVASSWPV